MSTSFRRRLLVPVAVSALLLGLAACGDEDTNASDDPSSPSTSASSSFAPPPSELVLKVLKEGTGDVVQSGDAVTVDYQGTNWTSGQIFDQSYGSQPATFKTNEVVPGFGAALVGQKVGSQVVVGIPPEFGYGTAGQPSANIAGTDTLVFVIDIKSTGSEPVSCTTKPGAASNSVKVTGAFGKKATPTFRKGLKAAGLQRTVVKAGNGPATKSGDSLSLLVAVYNARTGKEIETAPLGITLGDAGVPEPFQVGPACAKIGSRVVTVFPATEMFGTAGSPTAGVEPGDSLVLVTDVIKIEPKTEPAALPEVNDWTDAPEVTFNGTNPPTLVLPKA